LELKGNEEEEEGEEDKDTWYNIPFNSDNLDDDSPEPCLTLLTSLAFTIPKTTRKEYNTGARIKAIYILE
jgi:hypothetical protein